MSSESKPCPYCGGDTAAHQLEGEMWVAGCDDPFCRGYWDGSPVSGCAEVAVNLANKRYERTCHFSRGHNGNDTEKQELPRCSACGEEVDGYMCDFYADLGGDVVLEYPYRYCPNCGAKVVEE